MKYRQIFEMTAKHVAVVIIYGLAFLLLYFFARNFFTHPGWSTWYMPAGLRVASMVLLPIRYWPTILITEHFANRLITIYYGGTPLPYLEVLPKLIVIYTLYALAIFPIKKWCQQIDFGQLLFTVLLLLAIVGHNLVSATNLVFFSHFYQNIPLDRRMELWLSFLTGNTIGALLIAPLILGAYQLYRQRIWPRQLSQVGIIVSSLVLLAMVIFLYVKDPDSLYVLAALSLLPIFIYSYFFNWVGGVFSSAIVMWLLASSLYGEVGSLSIQQIQFFMIAIACTGLLFSASVTEQKQLSQALKLKNSQLQKLAHKLVQAQEHERKRISNELHDDVGQTVTALKTELKVLERKMPSGLQTELGRIHYVGENIYDAVYRLMHQLRPRVLDEYGLKKALLDGPLPQMLRAADISFHLECPDDIQQIPADIQITLYRICQEALSNTVKHSGASSAVVFIEIISTNVKLLVKDNGQLRNSGQVDGGYGLVAIEERAIAMDGSIQFTQSSEGTTLSVQLPIR